ncbi:MAG TPA: hypothetical protein VLT59_07730, partial [Steroidobacteraceae bacterium]|nr:hypothetical protein [Steroidobacteraceae bacterium]
GEHWLVLGEMAELGVDAARMHADVGRHARATGVTRLLAVGPGAHAAVEAFGAGAEWFDSIDALIAAARPALGPGITVLIKGSRINRLERVAAALADGGQDAGSGSH